MSISKTLDFFIMFLRLLETQWIWTNQDTLTSMDPLSMSFIVTRYKRTYIASAVLNMKNTEKSVIFTCFIGLYAFRLLPFLNALS